MTPGVWEALIWAAAAVLVAVIVCATILETAKVRNKNYVN